MEKVWQTTKQQKTYGESVADDKITENIWRKCGRQQE